MRKIFRISAAVFLTAWAPPGAFPQSVEIGEATAGPGGVALVPINVSATTDTAGLNLWLQYDPALFESARAERGWILQGAHVMRWHCPSPGRLNILAYSPTGPAAFTARSGTAVFAALKVKPTAPSIVTPISFASDNPANLPPSELSDLEGTGITHSRQNGQVTIVGGMKGAPWLWSIGDFGGANAAIWWFDPNVPPWQYLGFAWDIYMAQWADRGWNNTIWYPYPAEDTSGTLGLLYSGAYHVWVSSQYPDGAWYPCGNPWTGILYSGPPHTPANVQLLDLGARRVGVRWNPDVYGTWHYQIVAYHTIQGWVPIQGPSGNQVWQFVFYPDADFMNGAADFTVPLAGDYWFFIRGVGWLPPWLPGEFAIQSASRVQ